MNDEGLANFDAIAIVEPHIFQDPDTGKPHTGYYRDWQAVTPTVHRTDGHLRHSFRAMIWVNHKLRITRVPVQSYDITAALIHYPEGPKLIIVAYDSNDNTNQATTQAEALQEKLQLIDSTIRASRQEHGQDLGLLFYSDMNRHHPLWGGSRVGDHQRRHEADDMVEMALDLQLQSLLQPGTITWEHQARHLQSTVDVVLTDATLTVKMIRCCIYSVDHGSDHKAIEASFDHGRNVTQPMQPGRLLMERAAWDKINRQLEQTLRPFQTPRDSLQLDEEAEYFTATVTAIIQMHTPRARPSPYAKRWWSAELTMLRQSVTSLRNGARTATRRGEDASSVKRQLQTARTLYFQKIDEQKKAHWKEFLDDPANIWKANEYTKATARDSSIPELHKGDYIARQDEDKASLLMETFFQTPPKPGVIETLPKPILPTTRPPARLPPITDKEVYNAIFMPGQDKAPGTDEVTFRAWRHMFLATKTWIKNIYQASLDLKCLPTTWKVAKIVVIQKPNKPDYSLPKAYRPISLLMTVSKGLEAIVARRLSCLAEQYGLLPVNHFGGRRQRSCEQALDVLVEKIHEAKRRGRILSLVTFDVQGAFNGVHTKVLCRRLRHRLVPHDLIRWIRDFCSNRQGSIMVGRHLTEKRRIDHAGIPQGSPLSPILYIF